MPLHPIPLYGDVFALNLTGTLEGLLEQLAVARAAVVDELTERNLATWGPFLVPDPDELVA
jgi:hypothetical protein